MNTAWSLRARATLGCIALFCAATAGAMHTYAGGSWLHPNATSHVFFENFWCDLLRDPAHNGRPNTLSVRLGTLAFAALAGALCCFWLEFAGVLRGFPAFFVRAAGAISALATALTALVPSDRFPNGHAPVVLMAGGLGFACGCVCAGWALRHFREARVFGVASLLLIVAASVNLVLYVSVVYLDGPDTLVLPAAQKVASLALVVWLVAGLQISANRPKP